MYTETDLELADGRTLHFYDTDPTGEHDLAVFWHHGSPNIGAPPEPLFAAAVERGIRWVSYDRPSYGGSSPNPGRDVGSAAGDVGAIADALGLVEFAVMGHSGGASHALACAALLPERVLAVVWGSGVAPAHAEGLDYFAGMVAGGAAELRAASRGREALAAELASSGFDPEMFTAADERALETDWAWLGRIAGQAIEQGPEGIIDDDLAAVAPWGFEPGPVRPPLLLLHGEDDRTVPSSHSTWMATRNPSAELWLRPGEGHVSVLSSDAVAALDWIVAHARRG